MDRRVKVSLTTLVLGGGVLVIAALAAFAFEIECWPNGSELGPESGTFAATLCTDLYPPFVAAIFLLPVVIFSVLGTRAVRTESFRTLAIAAIAAGVSPVLLAIGFFVLPGVS